MLDILGGQIAPKGKGGLTRKTFSRRYATLRIYRGTGSATEPCLLSRGNPGVFFETEHERASDLHEVTRNNSSPHV